MEGENSSGSMWPQRNYTCGFCKRQFNSAQALGGHMNVHRRDRAMLIQLPSWVFDQSPNPNSISSSKSHPNPNFPSLTDSSSSTTTTTTLLPHRHYTHQYPFHLPSSSSSAVTVASFSFSPYKGRKSTDQLEDMTKKNMRGVVEVEESKKNHFGQKKYHREIEVSKKGHHEVTSLDLEIGCKDSKEVLDLELRLGCF